MKRARSLIPRHLPVALMGGVSLLVAACSGGQAQNASTGESSAAGSGASSGQMTSGNGSGNGSGSASGGNTTTSSGGSSSSGGAAPPLDFPDKWINGENCSTEPKVQTWKLTEDTYIFRQSVCTNFEAPFLYLLFGADKVLLEDTGTGSTNVSGPINAVIQEWLSAHGKTSIQLVVAHSHSHGDHIGGDSQFKGQPNTTVVGTSVSAVQTFFGIQSWPTQIVQYDLGGRVLDVIPIPGHQQAHIAVYDRELDLLLTGDTLYPGRLYIDDWQSYKASIGRMTDFVDAGNPVTLILGAHIEMDTTGADYVMQAKVHPNEHPPQLTYPVLTELHDAVIQLGNTPKYQAHPDFIIYP